MTDRLGLLEDRLVGLIVPASIDGIFQPPNVQVMLGQVEMLLVVCDSIQLDAVDGVALAA